MSDARSASRPSQHPYPPLRGFETPRSFLREQRRLGSRRLGSLRLGSSLALCHQIGVLSRTAAFQMKLAGELRVLIAAAGLAARLQASSPLLPAQPGAQDPAARRSAPGAGHACGQLPSLRGRCGLPPTGCLDRDRHLPALPTRALADDCRSQGRTWQCQRSQGY